MPDITKIAFLNSIWILKEYLSDIVIGGGWAPLIYYHYLLGDKSKNPVRTFDIDLMVRTSVPVKGDKKIDQLLIDADLKAIFKSMDTPPIIHYEGNILSSTYMEHSKSWSKAYKFHRISNAWLHLPPLSARLDLIE